jgi:uncharacterized membrane protein YecN with MAPEG domain
MTETLKTLICGSVLLMALVLHFTGLRSEASWVALLGLVMASVFTVDAKRRKARK